MCSAAIQKEGKFLDAKGDFVSPFIIKLIMQPIRQDLGLNHSKIIILGVKEVIHPHLIVIYLIHVEIKLILTHVDPTR